MNPRMILADPRTEDNSGVRTYSRKEVLLLCQYDRGNFKTLDRRRLLPLVDAIPAYCHDCGGSPCNQAALRGGKRRRYTIMDILALQCAEAFVSGCGLSREAAFYEVMGDFGWWRSPRDQAEPSLGEPLWMGSYAEPVGKSDYVLRLGFVGNLTELPSLIPASALDIRAISLTRQMQIVEGRAREHGLDIPSMPAWQLDVPCNCDMGAAGDA